MTLSTFAGRSGPSKHEQEREQERQRRIADSRSALGRAKELLESARAQFPDQIDEAEMPLIDAESALELSGAYRDTLRARAEQAREQAAELRKDAILGDAKAREKATEFLEIARDAEDELRAEGEAVPRAVAAVLDEHAAVLGRARDLFAAKRADLLAADEKLRLQEVEHVAALARLRAERMALEAPIMAALSSSSACGEVLTMIRAEWAGAPAGK